MFPQGCDPSNYEKVHRKARCPVPNCKEKLNTVNTYGCKTCGTSVCLKHRFPADHDCTGRTGKPTSSHSHMLQNYSTYENLCINRQWCWRRQLCVAARRAAEQKPIVTSMRNLFGLGTSGAPAPQKRSGSQAKPGQRSSTKPSAAAAPARPAVSAANRAAAEAAERRSGQHRVNILSTTCLPRFNCARVPALRSFYRQACPTMKCNLFRTNADADRHKMAEAWGQSSVRSAATALGRCRSCSSMLMHSTLLQANKQREVGLLQLHATQNILYIINVIVLLLLISLQH